MDKTDEISVVDHTVLDLKSGYGKRVVNLHAVAQKSSDENDNKNELIEKSIETICAINPQDHMQLMLASQMTSLHNFQQKMMYFAVNINQPDAMIKFASLAAKLSNVFVQQVHLMKTLQAVDGNKVIFENVHVHSGAQAVVGTVHTSTPNKSQEEKK
jgi:hypothetical protein